MRREAAVEQRAYHHGNLRQALVDAGVELARTGGPNAVVLRAASRQAGVSHNAVYRHFANQEDLLAAVAEQCMKRLSSLMLERMSRVAARERKRRARERLEAIGRAYIDFARSDPGWFRTAFSSARPHGTAAPAGSARAESARAESARAGSAQKASDDAIPMPYEVLSTALDDLVDAGAVTPEVRARAEYPAWSAVHGLSSLLLDGPLRDLPEAEVEQAIATVLANVNRGLM